MSATIYSEATIRGLYAERKPAYRYVVGTRFVEIDTSRVWVVGVDALTGINAWFLDAADGSEIPFVLNDFVIYLNSTTGDDANDGLTPQTAIRSIAELKRRSPLAWGGKNEARFAAGTYLWPEVLASGTNEVFHLGRSFNPNGSVQDWIGGFDVVSGPHTAAVGSTSNVIQVTGGGLTPGALRGLFVEVTSGSQAPRVGQVASNDATSISLVRPLPGALAAGNAFRVVAPNVVIDSANTPYDSVVVFQGPPGAANTIQFQGIKFDVSVPSFGMLFVSASAIMDRCEIACTENIIFVLERARLDFTILDGSSTNRNRDARFAGCYLHADDDSGFGGSVAIQNYSKSFMSVVVADNVGFGAFSAGQFAAGQMDGDNCAVLAIESVGSVFGGAGGVPSKLHDAQSGFQYFFEFGDYAPEAVVTTGRMASMGLSGVDISDNEIHGTLTHTGGLLEESEVVGTGNVSVGQAVRDSGRLIFDEATVTLAGTVSQLTIDGVASTYAAVAAAPLDAISNVRLSALIGRT